MDPMTEENIMTLGALIASLQAMATGLGENTLVDVDLEFETDEPEIVGTIKTNTPYRDGKRLYQVHAVAPEQPVFRYHGERVVRERLENFALTAGHILAGLDGHPFVWSEGARRAQSYMARRMGATLITRSFADDLGLRVIEGQQPVGSGQFDWGRKRKPYGQLYVMECQMEPEPVKREQPEVTGNNEQRSGETA
jgi:hypothetical protein